MKRLLAVVFATFFIMSGCSDGNKVEAWSEKDFAIYDKDGNEVDFLTVQEPVINLSEYNDVTTCRNVKIGDRAITAINKYIINYGICVYGDYIFSIEECNIEDEIKKAALNDEEFGIFILLDKDFSIINVNDYININDEVEDWGYMDNVYWGFSFSIVNEKISDIMMYYKYY